MIVGVDAGALSIADDRLKVGVWRVTREAIRALIRVDRNHVYRLYRFGKERDEREKRDSVDGARVKEVWLPRLGWSMFWLPFHLQVFPVDVFLGMAQALPPFLMSYKIGFLYDLGFLFHPQAYGDAAVTLKKQTDDLVRRADHIVTISRTSKRDIERTYGVPDKTISVAYPGVSSAFSPAGPRYRSTRPYVLFVGSLNRAKDIPTLLAMVSHAPYDIYLIGGDFWPDPAIDETIERLRLTGRVRKLGVVPDEELPAYYRGAVAFVTAALHEGFCLPAAEAMACGTPVVALDRGALREVVGTGGIIAASAPSFRDALMKMGDEKMRTALSANATERAKRYTWEAFAQRIRSCLASAGRNREQ